MDKEIRYNPNCAMCRGKGFYIVSNTTGTQSTVHNCDCHVFYDMKPANYINLKKLYEIHDLLAYLYNALEHNDMSEQSQKVEKAINLLNEVKKGVFCDCNKPERGEKKENVCAVCGKIIELNYFG